MSGAAGIPTLHGGEEVNAGPCHREASSSLPVDRPRQAGQAPRASLTTCQVSGRAGMVALAVDHDHSPPTATYEPALATRPASAAAHRSSAWRSASVKASRSPLSTSRVPTTVPVPGLSTGMIASDRVLAKAVR